MSRAQWERVLFIQQSCDIVAVMSNGLNQEQHQWTYPDQKAALVELDNFKLEALMRGFKVDAEAYTD